MAVINVTNKSNPTLISNIRPEFVNECRQGWLTIDHRFFLFSDRNSGVTKTISVDVTNLDFIQIAEIFEADYSAKDSNHFVKDNHVYQASFRGGLRILEISPQSGSVMEVAYFDTYPEDDDAGVEGAIGVYPFFESGVVLISNVSDGLFIVRPTSISSMPSSRPSDNPTISSMPSHNPSSKPSVNPTISSMPSHNPSSKPSVNPTISSMPSHNPSSKPSVNPTISSMPSHNPSSKPSLRPSFRPSEFPSSAPSATPSLSPTHSFAPSSKPTISSFPSSIPTESSVPSSEPTISSVPSNSPTVFDPECNLNISLVFGQVRKLLKMFK